MLVGIYIQKPGLFRTGAISNNVYKCIGQATSIRAMFKIAPLVSPAFRAHNYLMLQSSKMIPVRLDSAQNSVHMGIKIAAENELMCETTQL